MNDNNHEHEGYAWDKREDARDGASGVYPRGTVAVVDVPAAPRPVTRGVKSQIGLDWIRLTGPAESASRCFDVLSRIYGQKIDRRNGRHFYERGTYWPSGAALLEGHKSRSAAILVELPGSALSVLPAADRVLLLNDLSWQGMRATRIDVAVDFIGEDVDVITCTRSACFAGELCQAKRWEPHEGFSGGQRDKYGVSLGSRGKSGSGRYVRVYDKGLETGEKPEGRWHRWEAEFTGDCAAEVQHQLVAHVEQLADGGFRIAPGWEQTAAGVAFGAVDFREVNGQTSFARRPRSSWWAELVGTVKRIVVKATPKASRLITYARWMRQQVLPSLKAMGDAVGLPWSQIADMVAGDFKVSNSARRSPVVYEFCRMFDFPLPKSSIPGATVDFVGDGVAPF